VKEGERKGDRSKDVGRFEGWDVGEKEVARSESEVESKEKRREDWRGLSTR
jgi:hypothetical protein